MSRSRTRRARFGAKPTQGKQPHNNQHGIATGNADPYQPMAETQFFRVFTPRAVRLALHDLVGHYGIGQDDLPDMVQELLVTAWQASVGYDPDYVSPKTGTRTEFAAYIWSAMKNKALMILRSRKRRVDVIPVTSLDDPADNDENPRWREEKISLASWMRKGASPEFASMFDRVDLEFAIAELPQNLRQEAQLLVVERRPVAEVAVAVGLKPSTLYFKHIPAIEVGIARVLREHG